MLSQEDINHQQGLLGIHRRNLAHLVNQAAQYGGVTFAPPFVVNSIGEARENIRRIKQVLRDSGVNIANETNDEPTDSVRSPVAPISGPHITINSGDYVAGEKQIGVDQRGQSVQGNQNNAVGAAKGEQMSVFDQRGQHVNYQYNAAGDINFGAVQNRMDLVGELEKLKAELSKAGAAQIIDAEVVTDAEYQITKAVQEAKKPEPKKETILERIDGAKKLIDSVAAASGLVTGLITAAELVEKFF
jgi:hypothetical protein